jgi:CheY-like chemotaxis protein
MTIWENQVGGRAMQNREFENVRVLLVDDDEFARDIMISMLQELKVRAMTQAENGALALEHMAGGLSVDVVIADWEMPVMDGIEFTKAVRAQPDLAKAAVPIVMVTSHSQISEVKMARDAGASEFLVKPFSVSSLAKRLRMALVNPRPFVKATSFVGPDRRRRANSDYEGEQRRGNR